jgi:hypothetical protein
MIWEVGKPYKYHCRKYNQQCEHAGIFIEYFISFNIYPKRNDYIQYRDRKYIEDNKGYLITDSLQIKSHRVNKEQGNQPAERNESGYENEQFIAQFSQIRNV